jgi:signal transduction histidine kinase
MPVDLNSVVRRLLPMLQDLAGSVVQLDVSYAEETCVVLADALQIDQILMNLCTNARDAMPEGGVVMIRTEKVTLAEPYSASHSVIKPGRYGMLTVKDTGSGMDEATSKRIFEPFFTTKEPGKGTGLGLATVFGIVQLHKGAVDVRSVAGTGTDFRIYLPDAGNRVMKG